jgi:hypothetical protein
LQKKRERLVGKSAEDSPTNSSENGFLALAQDERGEVEEADQNL